MRRPLLGACIVGVVVGSVMYSFFIPDWFTALGTAALYVGASYFYFAYDLPLLRPGIEFADRTDKLGYAIGLFGTSIIPLAFGAYYTRGESATLSFILSFVGVITFLLFSAKAYYIGN